MRCKLIIFKVMNRLLNTLKEHPVLIVILLGLIYRLIFLISYLNSPDWEQLLVDSLFHDRWAMSIASGNIWGDEVYFRAPFFIYILGFIYSIVGHSLLAARIFGHIIGLVSVFLTFKITSRLFSRRAGIIAGLLHALYPICIYFESELLVDNLFAMLVELSLWLLLIHTDKKKIRHYLMIGLVIGLAAITRPVILALVPLYIIWILRSVRPIAESAGKIILVLMAMVMVILPITIRNYVVADNVVLISSSGGVNFYIGNNENADGLSAAMPRPLGRNWEIKDVRFAAEKATGQSLQASEVSDFWLRRGWQWISNNPGDFIKLYLKKLYHCFNGFEISNNRNLKLFTSGFGVFRFNPLNFSILLAVALFSIMVMLLTRTLKRESIFLIAFVAFYFLTMSFFFINARFRLPVLPYMMILGAFGLDYLIMNIKSRPALKIITPALLVAIGAVIFSATNIYGLDRANTAGGYFNRGNYYLYLDDLVEAEKYFRLALQESPDYTEAGLNMGVVHLKLGRADSAEYYFRRELNLYPDNPRAYANLASLYYLQIDYTSAKEMALAALKIKPYFADAHIMLMRIHYANGDRAALDKAVEQSLNYANVDPGVYLNAGLIYSELQEYNRAFDMLTRVLRQPEKAAETNDLNFNYTRLQSGPGSPVKGRAAYQLGYLYGVLDRIPESIEMSRLAIEYDSSLVEAYINLINAFSISGRRLEAVELLNIATAKFPDNEILKLQSERIK